MESVIKALKERPRGSEFLMRGDFKANFNQPEGYRREEDIAAALTEAWLEDMSAHFLLQRRPWCRDKSMWNMVRAGRRLRSQTDYILDMYRHLFRDMSARDPRHNLDHYLVLGCICSASLSKHTKYLGRSTRLLLWTLTNPMRENRLFAELRRAISKTKAQEARRNAWILVDMWSLVD